MTGGVSVAGLVVALAALVGLVAVATVVGIVLWLRQRRAHQRPEIPPMAETVAQLRVRKTRESERDPETTQVLRLR